MPAKKDVCNTSDLTLYGGVCIKVARYIRGYRLWIVFDDGTCGEIDLYPLPGGPVFEPLKDKQFFARVVVDDELETLVWPNGADLAPEYVKALQLAQCGND